MSCDRASAYLYDNRVRGWLQEVAGEVLLCLATHLDLSGRPVAEIGVHHGKFAIFLGLLTGGRLAGFDLFEKQVENVDRSGHGDRRRFLQNCDAHGLAPDQVKAVSVNSTALRPADMIAACGGRPVIVSVDGGHTEALTRNDLAIAAEAVAEDGIVVLDDFFNQRFPEVCVGAFRFLEDNPGRLTAFCISGGKVFFARDPALATRYCGLLGERPARIRADTDLDECCTFFGATVRLIHRRRPESWTRARLRRTALWRRLRRTPVGLALRRVLAR